MTHSVTLLHFGGGALAMKSRKIVFRLSRFLSLMARLYFKGLFILCVCMPRVHQDTLLPHLLLAGSVASQSFCCNSRNTILQGPECDVFVVSKKQQSGIIARSIRKGVNLFLKKCQLSKVAPRQLAGAVEHADCSTFPLEPPESLGSVAQKTAT